MSTLSFAKKIASKTRYAGTEGERDAYELISNEFESLGYNVTKEETEYIKSEKYLIIWAMILPLLFLVFVTASWLVHPLTMAILIIVLVALLERVLKKLALELAKDKSINVVATINSERKERLILCGHYDSSRVLNRIAQRARRALRTLEPFFILAAVAYIAILFVRGVYLLATQEFNLASLIELSPRMDTLWTIVWSAYLIFGSALVFLASSYASHLYTKRFSYGADDNASGIAVMLETARRLKDEKLNLRVDYACFAAEEKGLFGSRKWVNKHLKELDKDKTYVLNIDCVGRGEKFFVYKGFGTIFKKYSDPTLCGILAEACSELDLPLEEDWSGRSDHAEFVEKKFRTCAISRSNPAKAGVARLILRRMFGIPVKQNVIPVMEWIHTENDTVDNIDEQKLEESVQVVVKFVEKLNQKVAQWQ